VPYISLVEGTVLRPSADRRRVSREADRDFLEQDADQTCRWLQPAESMAIFDVLTRALD